VPPFAYAVIANALEDALGVNLSEIEVPITPEFVLRFLNRKVQKVESF